MKKYYEWLETTQIDRPDAMTLNTAIGNQVLAIRKIVGNSPQASQITVEVDKLVKMMRDWMLPYIQDAGSTQPNPLQPTV